MFELRCGDAIQLLKSVEDNSINVTVTSPPYNKHKKGSSKKSLEKKYVPGFSTNGVFRSIEYDNFSDSLPEEEYQEQQISLLNTLYDKTVTGGSVFYNHKIRYLKGTAIPPWQWLLRTNWHVREEIIWNRGSAVEISGYRFLQCDERIYWLVKGAKHPKLDRDAANWSSVWKFGAALKNEHPAPYPLLLPLRCIRAVLKTPGVVFDPYNGLGTTGVAATLLGHQYLGFDCSQRYLDEADKRIREPWNSDKKTFQTFKLSTPDSICQPATLEHLFKR